MERLFFKGLPVSGGVGLGKICVFQHENYEINHGKVEEAQIQLQIVKLDLAIQKTLHEIFMLKNDLKSQLHKDGNLILDVYKAILEDKYFIQEIKTKIKEQGLYAENAVELCINSYIQEIEESSNEYVKQRIYDLNDISSRLIKHIIGGSEPDFDKIYHKQVVAVKELTPTLAAALGKKKVMGIIADEGAAYFSHAAIILRGLGIPTLNDVNFINVKKSKDNNAIIDGNEGILIINPENSEIERYRTIFKDDIRRHKELIKKKNKATITVDGVRIRIYANVGNLEEGTLAKDRNLDGIGLVRTEILFVGHSTMPDEREQYLTYLKIIKKMKNKPVVFRTVDFGGDKIAKYMEPESILLGKDLRGIARSLVLKEEFIVQLRAILRAARQENVSIAFPMVSHVAEIKEAKSMIHRIMSELSASDEKAIRGIRIGAVIETREGVQHLEEILKEVDFISIGTNDLFQEIMGVDRINFNIKDAEYLHPVFLKIVQRCVDKANRKGKKVTICGEMASDPLAATLLVGMGICDLSMAPAKTVGIKEVITKISFAESKLLFKKIMQNNSATQVKDTVAQWLKDRM